MNDQLQGVINAVNQVRQAMAQTPEAQKKRTDFYENKIRQPVLQAVNKTPYQYTPLGAAGKPIGNIIANQIFPEARPFNQERQKEFGLDVAMDMAPGMAAATKATKAVKAVRNVEKGGIYYIGKQLDDLVEIANRSKNAEDFFEILRPVQRDRIRSMEPLGEAPRPTGNQGIYDFYSQVTGTKPVVRGATSKLIEIDTSLEDEVIKNWGESTSDNASFITSDGRFIGWGGGGTRYADHREIVGDVVDEGGTEGLIEYMAKTKNIRVHNVPNTTDINIDLVYKPNQEQLDAIKEMFEGKSNIYADFSTVEGGLVKSGQYSNFIEWYSDMMKYLKN